MTIKWPLLLLSLLITACGSPLSENEKVLYRIIGKHKRLPSSKELSVCGAGGSIPDQIHAIIIDYMMTKAVDVAEARGIFSKHIASLVKVANEDPDLERCAIEYPFDYSNMVLGILFKKKEFGFQEPPYVAYVFNVSDEISYNIFDGTELLEVEREKLPPLPTHEIKKLQSIAAPQPSSDAFCEPNSTP